MSAGAWASGVLTIAAATLALAAGPAWATQPGSNGSIAFSTTREGNYEIYSMSPAGALNTPANLSSHLGHDIHPAWSPDGARIAFASDRDGGANEIYVMQADGTGKTRLTTNAAQDWEPTWSPDGTKIAFRSERTGGSDIYSMSAVDANSDGEGDNMTRLTLTTEEELGPDWSATGRIAFTRHGSTSIDLWTMAADGSDQVAVSGGEAAADPSWSPDGTKLLFLGTTPQELRTIPAAGGSATVLNVGGMVPFGGEWSPDGTAIVLSASVSGDAEVFTVPAAGSNTPTRLTTSAGCRASRSRSLAGRTRRPRPTRSRTGTRTARSGPCTRRARRSSPPARIGR